MMETQSMRQGGKITAKILWPHELVFGRWQRGLWQRAERVREGGEGTRGGHRGGQSPGSTNSCMKLQH